MVTQALRGLQLQYKTSEVRLLCSGGIVMEQSINNDPWTLGSYIELNGGVSSRTKKVRGIVSLLVEGEPSAMIRFGKLLLKGQ